MRSTFRSPEKVAPVATSPASLMVAWPEYAWPHAKSQLLLPYVSLSVHALPSITSSAPAAMYVGCARHGGGWDFAFAESEAQFAKATQSLVEAVEAARRAELRRGFESLSCLACGGGGGEWISCDACRS